MEDKKALASCVAVIFPICAVSAIFHLLQGTFSLITAAPYLLGGLAGGYVGGKIFQNVSNVWLRRIFALFLLYGGVRYLL